MTNNGSASQDGQQNASPASGGDQKAPDPVNTAISSGHPLDRVGGAGLGQPPGESDVPAITQPTEKKAADPQDRRDTSA
ncbi:MAG TPA: hypothetical protein VGU61_05900 [Noviherbaspirillum sp.]|jgi:hypothetical protein|uniref:hypothetical protein n=1 Tax=Noviherbaspirillum sp. TaxID=1926288 RepID=UPI002DDD3BFB|nr:hypothetical protein [Noviherbaspirillum sp.]HEV2609782.1 hypothetical protein [Noviherbaspirillum sp.]